MRKHIPLLLSLSAFLLQGCLTVTTRDILKRSTSRWALPNAPVHLPARDSSRWVQASVAVSGMRTGSTSASLDFRPPAFSTNSDESTNESTSLEGPAMLEMSKVAVAAEVSLLAERTWRLGVGMNASRTGGAGWAEVGLAFGNAWPAEFFAAFGGASVRSTQDWTLTTHRVDHEMELDDSTWTDTTIVTHGVQPLYRLGVHVGRRAGGPWAEAELGSVDLFDCPRTEGTWGLDYAQIGMGWLQRTEFGDWTAFLRGTTVGKDWIPSAGIQWTANLKLRD